MKEGVGIVQCTGVGEPEHQSIEPHNWTYAEGLTVAYKSFLSTSFLRPQFLKGDTTASAIHGRETEHGVVLESRQS